MAVFGTEQDTDVARRDRARLVCRRIANERAGVEQPTNLCGHRFGVIRDARGCDDAERIRGWNRQLDGEGIVLTEAECIAAVLVFLDLREEVVREREQLRNRPEALRDCTAR